MTQRFSWQEAIKPGAVSPQFILKAACGRYRTMVRWTSARLTDFPAIVMSASAREGDLGTTLGQRRFLLTGGCVFGRFSSRAVGTLSVHRHSRREQRCSYIY